jgi:flagellar M-ring protein FliF
MIMRLTALAPGGMGPGGGLLGLPAGAAAAFAGPGGGGQQAIGGPGGSGMAGGGDVAGLIEDESMVNMSNIEGQLRASALRKLADLVEKHPDETVTIMRGWMAQENG